MARVYSFLSSKFSHMAWAREVTGMDEARKAGSTLPMSISATISANSVHLPEVPVETARAVMVLILGSIQSEIPMASAP